MTTNGMVSLRPLVVLAIKVMGPGRRRVDMVRLAHDMNDARTEVRPSQGRLHFAADQRPQAVPSQQRAA